MQSYTNFQYPKEIVVLPIFKPNPYQPKKIANIIQNGLNLSQNQMEDYLSNRKYYNNNGNINISQNMYNYYFKKPQMSFRRKTNSNDFTNVKNNINTNNNINASLNKDITNNLNNSLINNFKVNLNNNIKNTNKFRIQSEPQNKTINNNYNRLQNSNILVKNSNLVSNDNYQQNNSRIDLLSENRNFFDSFNNKTIRNQDQTISIENQKPYNNLYRNNSEFNLTQNIKSHQNISDANLNFMKTAPMNTQRLNNSNKNAFSDAFNFDRNRKSSRCKNKSNENINFDRAINRMNNRYEIAVLDNKNKNLIIKDGKKLVNIDINIDIQEKDEDATNYSVNFNSYNEEQKLVNDNSVYNLKNSNNNIPNTNNDIRIYQYKKDKKGNFSNKINNIDNNKATPINHKNSKKIIMLFNSNNRNQFEDSGEKNNYTQDINIYENKNENKLKDSFGYYDDVLAGVAESVDEQGINEIYKSSSHTNSFYKKEENQNKKDINKKKLYKQNIETIELPVFSNSNSNFYKSKKNDIDNKNPNHLNKNINIYIPNSLSSSNLLDKNNKINESKSNKTIILGQINPKTKQSFAKILNNNLKLTKKSNEKIENSPNKRIILENNDEKNEDFDTIKIDKTLNTDKRIPIPLPIPLKNQKCKNTHIILKGMHSRSPPKFYRNIVEVPSEETVVIDSIKIKPVKDIDKLNESNKKSNESKSKLKENKNKLKESSNRLRESSNKFNENNNKFNENNNKFNENSNKIEQNINHIENKNFSEEDTIVNHQEDDINNITINNIYYSTQLNSYFKIHKLLTKAGKGYDGKEKINQDKPVAQISVNNIFGLNIFGVLDGHGENGHHISNLSSIIIIDQFTKFIQKLNTKNLESIYHEVKKDNFSIIKYIYSFVDKELSKQKFDVQCSGTTCVLVFQIGNILICSNAGDSRGILIYNENGNNKIFELSHDQKPELPKEKERINQHGGVVKQMTGYFGLPVGPFRVWLGNENYPGLAMSRSLGDFSGKKCGVISEPEIIEYTLTDDSKYMVLCSDGVWEFLNNEDVMSLGNDYYEKNDIDGFINQLMNISVQCWEREDFIRDDITSVVVFF